MSPDLSLQFQTVSLLFFIWAEMRRERSPWTTMVLRGCGAGYALSGFLLLTINNNVS